MLPRKRFSKNIEDFTCAHCGATVKGNGYTDHCPTCLWSRHVDGNPGDRRSSCHGMMKPVRAEYSHSGFAMVHRCEKCGIEKRCRAAPADNTELLVSLSNRS